MKQELDCFHSTEGIEYTLNNDKNLKNLEDINAEFRLNGRYEFIRINYITNNKSGSKLTIRECLNPDIYYPNCIA